MSGSEKSRLLTEQSRPVVRLLLLRWRLLAGSGAADLLRLLGQQNGLDVRQNTTLSDGDARQQLVQFLVVADGQLEMTRNDASLLVVAGGVACQLENFGSQVFHDGGQVDRSTGTDALGIVALAQKTVDTTDRKLKTGTARSALCLSLDFASFTTSRHFSQTSSRLID